MATHFREQESMTENTAGVPSVKVWSVTQLNRLAKNLLETNFSGIWIEAEISNFKRHSSGHMYLSLKDEQSQIGAVFFSRANAGLTFEPKDGLKVLAFGRISLYEPRGQYQFYIEKLEPRGQGALQLAFQQLREKLEKEGLFDPRHKKMIPKFPGTVGIITSPTGAAIRDILNVVHRRFYGTHVLLCPVKVQGDGAAEEIANAISIMNEFGGIDVLIVGRGGGSLEDLWAFNEERVARAVYASGIPVISAVGHEIDWTICDLVADLRAPTPSAAAELVVQNSEELERHLLSLHERMKFTVITLVDAQKERLKTLQTSYAFKYPANLIDQFTQKTDELLRQLQNYARAFVTQKRQRFQVLAGQLNALSPLAILERGYSLTFDERGGLLKRAAECRQGQLIVSRLRYGRVTSKVVEIHPEGE